MNIKEQIQRYQPYNEQEETDKKIILSYYEQFEDIFYRENPFAHFSASCWAINHDRTKILMVYHKIYDSWSWTGGHADGDTDLLHVAIKELQEETGIINYKVLDEDIFSLEILGVDGHVKKGKYISSHVHLNLTYLIEVDDDDVLMINEEENTGVKWIDTEDIDKEVSEQWILDRIYKKEINKVKERFGI